ncbi:MAG: Wzz/FepE/Etk N-terminal domain-containing protein [Anaerolineales bacterium]
MDDELEIDLRKLIRSLFQRWKYILGVALLTGLVAFAFTYLQPRRYEARAVIALTRPLNLPNFDPRYESFTPLTIGNKLVSDVALGDKIVQMLFDSWNEPDKDIDDLPTFRKSLSVEVGSESTVATLSVKLKDPQEAARLAQLWAGEVVSRINATYGGRDENQVAFFEQQVATAQQRFQAAAQALQVFATRNERNTLQNQWNSLSAQQAELLRRLRVIDAVQADAKLFLEQVRALPAESLLSSQEQTNLFLLQMRIYGDTLAGIASASQYQLAIPQFTSQTTVGEYREALTAWLKALEQQKSELSAALETLPPQMEALQGRIQALDNESKRLEMEYQLANETLMTLNRKLDEVRIAVQDNTGYASLAVPPSVPRRPLPRGTLRNTALAAALGAFLAVFGVLVWDWWRSEEEQPSLAKEKAIAREPLGAAK